MTKKANPLKTMGTILFVGLIFFTVVFGTYQIFFDKAEAQRWNCNWSMVCQFKDQECDGTLDCTCKGDILPLCFIGDAVPEQ